jgi:hypothetical protein
MPYYTGNVLVAHRPSVQFLDYMNVQFGMCCRLRQALMVCQMWGVSGAETHMGNQEIIPSGLAGHFGDDGVGRQASLEADSM